MLATAAMLRKTPRHGAACDVAEASIAATAPRPSDATTHPSASRAGYLSPGPLIDLDAVYWAEVQQHAPLREEDELHLGRQLEVSRYIARVQRHLAQAGARRAADLLSHAYTSWHRHYSVVLALYPPTPLTSAGVLRSHEQLRALVGLTEQRLALVTTGTPLRRHEVLERVYHLAVLCRLLPEEVHWRVAQEVVARGEPMLPVQVAAWCGHHRHQATQHCTELQAAGAQAHTRLIEANLRLVLSVARSYRNRGVEWPDLIQEGNLGLLHAVAQFDFRRGGRLSTYAMRWIREAMRRALVEQGRSARLPSHIIAMRPSVARAAHGLAKEQGREHSVERHGQTMLLPLAQEQELYRASPGRWTLDTSIGEAVGEPPAVLEDPHSPLRLVVAAEPRPPRAVQQLSGLTERERQVIELRFGLTGPAGSRAEVAGQLGVSHERVRQLESQALQKLRTCPRLQAQREGWA
jgi:RNA polymerase primary sigma factor